MRISVVGNSGSGKSTAASKIATRLEIPRLELDAVRHQPNWAELPDPEFKRRTLEFADSHSSWVIDGNYGIVRPEVWARAELVVWMNPPKAENMRNIVSRTVRRVVGRQKLWNGNRERWTNLLSADPYKSVIAWSWTRHAVIQQRYTAAQDDPRWSHLRFVELASREELERWLAEL